VFLRLPSSGSRLRLEEAAFPSETYFNSLALATAAGWIDFRDLPDHDDFVCPDDSHLSPEAAGIFTKSLLVELRHRGLLATVNVFAAQH